jgi:hypothetical protein
MDIKMETGILLSKDCISSTSKSVGISGSFGAKK